MKVSPLIIFYKILNLSSFLFFFCKIDLALTMGMLIHSGHTLTNLIAYTSWLTTDQGHQPEQLINRKKKKNTQRTTTVPIVEQTGYVEQAKKN